VHFLFSGQARARRRGRQFFGGPTVRIGSGGVVGDCVGCGVGDAVGSGVGDAVGCGVGDGVGCCVGKGVGGGVGAGVGHGGFNEDNPAN